jgi:phosphocarrier protein
MVSRDIEITSDLGIHLRPAGAMCDEAIKYQSHISFEYGHNKRVANAKSIISILASGVGKGEFIKLMADGEDEEEAIEKVSSAFIKSMNDN